jgi:hypothetical protein
MFFAIDGGWGMGDSRGVMRHHERINGRRWTFDTESGKLEHPGGFLTSWFLHDGKAFRVTEWACDLNVHLKVELCQWIANLKLPTP